MKKSSQFSICVIMAVAVISTSCSSAVEKRAKHYQREGKTIVGSCRSSLFYYDDNALYCDNVEINKIDTVVNFTKEYKSLEISTRLSENKDVLFQKSQLLGASRLFSPKNGYEFLTIADWGVAVVKEGIILNNGINEKEPAYVFLLSQPNRYYCMYEIPVQFLRNRQKDPKHYPILDYLNFVSKSNCLSNLGDFIDDGIDKEPYDYLYANTGGNEWAKLNDLFEYRVEATLYYDGTCKFYTNGLEFPNLKSKYYSFSDVHNGKMLNDFNTLLTEQATRLIAQKVVAKAIPFSKIISDFKGNYSKAKKTYPQGEHLILKATLGKIVEVNYSDYKYRLETSYGLHSYLWIYTNDESFAEFDYPYDDVYLSVVFDRVETDGGLITIQDRYFVYTDGKFIFAD